MFTLFCINSSNGFKWLTASKSGSPTNYSKIPDNAILVTTTIGPYEIQQLEHFRHFAAHGQAISSSPFPKADYELLPALRSILAKGINDYWEYLKIDDSACEQLAKANILALRSHPVFKSWTLFEKDGKGINRSVEEIFNSLNWTV